ncbi:unnamed protein product [Diplocarpon coronariae]
MLVCSRLQFSPPVVSSSSPLKISTTSTRSPTASALPSTPVDPGLVGKPLPLSPPFPGTSHSSATSFTLSHRTVGPALHRSPSCALGGVVGMIKDVLRRDGTGPRPGLREEAPRQTGRDLEDPMSTCWRAPSQESPSRALRLDRHTAAAGEDRCCFGEWSAIW